MTLRGEVFASNIQKAKVLAEKSAACIALQQHEVVDETVCILYNVYITMYTV